MNAGTIAGIVLVIIVIVGVIMVVNQPDQQATTPEPGERPAAPATESTNPSQQEQPQTPAQEEQTPLPSEEQAPKEQPQTPPPEAEEQPPVMLSFSMVNGWNAPDWCNSLASVLARHEVKATVFVTGEVAEQNPQCVTAFTAQGSDVGSQTYRYVNLNVISDYEYTLEEVRMGKQAIDNAGNIDSRLFRAPFGTPPASLYSLLSSANITADFSSATKYAVYEDGQFVEYELVECDCIGSHERVQQLTGLHVPVMINIDNAKHPGQIESLIVSLKESNVKFASASEVTGLDLTASRA